jgi:hypothetical protein
LNKDRVLKNLKQYFGRFFGSGISFQSKIIGILLIIIGVGFFSNFSIFYIKIGVTSFLIGLFLIILIKDGNTANYVIDLQMVLILAIWIWIAYFVTINFNLEIFFILILIGILVINEITNEFTTVHFKKRINIFVFVFLIIFMVIIVRNIINA